MSLDDFSKRLSDGTVPVVPNAGVLEKVWDPTAMSETQRVEGVQFFASFKRWLIVFSDWKMMGCWLCIILILYIYIYVVLDWLNVNPEDLGEIYLADKGLCFRWVVQPPPHIC